MPKKSVNICTKDLITPVPLHYGSRLPEKLTNLISNFRPKSPPCKTTVHSGLKYGVRWVISTQRQNVRINASKRCRGTKNGSQLIGRRPLAGAEGPWPGPPAGGKKGHFGTFLAIFGHFWPFLAISWWKTRYRESLLSQNLWRNNWWESWLGSTTRGHTGRLGKKGKN